MVVEGYRKIHKTKPSNAKLVKSIFEVINIVPYGKYFDYDKDKPLYLNYGNEYYEYPMSVIERDDFCINEYINKCLLLI